MSANNCNGRMPVNNRMNPNGRMSANGCPNTNAHANARMNTCANTCANTRANSDINCTNQGRGENRNRSYSVDEINLPLGMAYVPWQKWCEVYDINKGFRVGTIFPELNKPFMWRGNC